MRSYLSRPAGIAFFLGVLGLTLVAYGASHKASEKHDHATHQHNDICAGFVVLPTGYVVLSAIDPSATSGMKHDMHHGKAHGDSHGKSDQQHMTSQKDMAHTSHMQHGAKTTEATDPLMGYKHGDDILQSKDRLCVPIGDMTSTAWKSVSAFPDLHVTAKSLSGALAHNSRANESLALHIMLDGKPVEEGQVLLLARMPHHDRRMPGGHGLANDPDVEGLAATPKGNGDYAMPTVDFSMGGAWFFEVHLKKGGKMYKAYFATEIGEE